MADVIVVGAGPVGLATSMLLAKDGQGMIDRVMSLAADHPPPETRQPSREELVQIANG